MLEHTNIAFELVENSSPDPSVVESQGSDAIPVGARMTVIGVGGAGGNAVSRMIEEGIPGVRFVVANTDFQALKSIERRHGSRAPTIVQLGPETTRGLGAGGRAEVGRRAIEESIDAVMRAIEGTDLLFITAGMGGGTGTGAAPVIASHARQKNILTICIVTTPFHYEGKRRMEQAEGGIAELTAAADTVIVVPNEKLLQVVPPGTSFRDALKTADSVLMNATRGISGILFRSGEINTDYADFRTIMGGGGPAILGCGSARGEGAARKAAEAAVCSPLLDRQSLVGATRILVNVRAPGSVDLQEVADAISYVQESAHADAELIVGMDFDDTVADEVTVTVVATGFEPDIDPTIGASSDRRDPREAAPVATPPSSDHSQPAAEKEKNRSFFSRLARGFRRESSPEPPRYDPDVGGNLSSLPARPNERPSFLRAN